MDALIHGQRMHLASPLVLRLAPHVGLDETLPPGHTARPFEGRRPASAKRERTHQASNLNLKSFLTMPHPQDDQFSRRVFCANLWHARCRYVACSEDEWPFFRVHSLPEEMWAETCKAIPNRESRLLLHSV